MEDRKTLPPRAEDEPNLEEKVRIIWQEGPALRLWMNDQFAKLYQVLDEIKTALATTADARIRQHEQVRKHSARLKRIEDALMLEEDDRNGKP